MSVLLCAIVHYGNLLDRYTIFALAIQPNTFGYLMATTKLCPTTTFKSPLLFNCLLWKPQYAYLHRDTFISTIVTASICLTQASFSLSQGQVIVMPMPAEVIKLMQYFILYYLCARVQKADGIAHNLENHFLSPDFIL